MWLVSQRGYIGLEVERKGFQNTSVCSFDCIICFDGLKVMYSVLKFSLFKSDSENLLRKLGRSTANRKHILARGILNSVQEIRNPTKHWNPESSSTDKE